MPYTVLADSQMLIRCLLNKNVKSATIWLQTNAALVALVTFHLSQLPSETVS